MDFNKLWQNFMDMVQNHYMDFNGRLGRAQYWYFILVCFVISILAAIIDGVVGLRILSALVGLGLLLPMGGASARRFQDTGRSGQPLWIWVIVSGIYQIIALLVALSGPLGMFYFFIAFGWLISLVGLVFLIATIAIIYFCAQPGQTGDNQFGPPPAPWTPN
jgi:uncharacterized membrane protein YhaH (DUF805 family)